MKTSGLTEKRMSNKRFRETEQAIFIAYYTLKDYPTARKLAKRAHISRATLYRHHSGVYAIPIDYEKYLLATYKKAIGRLLRKNAGIKTVFLRTLVFISNNRMVFIVLFRDGHSNAVKKMIELLKGRVLEEWHLGGDVDKIYNVYQYEILGVIEVWSKQKFATKQLDSILSDILYLTNAARRSLLPLQR